jgi:hypothetical protein
VTGRLTLRFTRISPTHHRFDYRREDGTGEARLKGSFYGILAKIGGYEELAVNGGAALGGEIAITERVVGAVTGALNDEALGDEAFIERVGEYLDLFEEKAPRWFTPKFMAAVRERLRQLTGRWKATPFGQTMELIFDPAA